MNPITIEIEGTLEPDGRLILDESPAMPPGRVRVALQAISDAADSDADVLIVLRRIHAAQEARGNVPRTREEIDAAINASRCEDGE